MPILRDRLPRPLSNTFTGFVDGEVTEGSFVMIIESDLNLEMMK